MGFVDSGDTGEQFIRPAFFGMQTDGFTRTSSAPLPHDLHREESIYLDGPSQEIVIPIFVMQPHIILMFSF